MQWVLRRTVGPEAEDLTSKVLDTAGKEVTKAAPLGCGVMIGGFGCKGGEIASVAPENLPWATLLELVSGVKTVDHLFSDGKGEPSYEIVCKGVASLCTGLELAEFVKNEAAGAKFEFKELEKATGDDGGEGTFKGSSITEGYTVS